jgi:hypothetical protein
MARFSIGRVWDEAWAFLRAESALLVPVALATIGAAMLLLTQVIPDPVNDALPRGPWLLWLIPVYVLMLAGIIAVSALVLRPGISVAESFRLALRRLPIAAGMVLLIAALSVVASVPVALASLIDVQRGGAPGGLTAMANGAMLAVTVWLWIRLLPMWAVVTDGRTTPLAVLRDSFALTRGIAGRLLGLTVIAGAAAIMVGAAILFGGGAVLMLIGRAIGGTEMAALLVAILMAVLVAAATTIWTVLIAILYRHLGAAHSTGN